MAKSLEKTESESPPVTFQEIPEGVTGVPTPSVTPLRGACGEWRIGSSLQSCENDANSVKVTFLPPPPLSEYTTDVQKMCTVGERDIGLTNIENEENWMGMEKMEGMDEIAEDMEAGPEDVPEDKPEDKTTEDKSEDKAA